MREKGRSSNSGTKKQHNPPPLQSLCAVALGTLGTLGALGTLGTLFRWALGTLGHSDQSAQIVPEPQTAPEPQAAPQHQTDPEL